MLVSSRVRLRVDKEETQSGLASLLPGRQPYLPLAAWALVSFRASITSKRAEHALLLLRGQWTILLCLKDWAVSGGGVGTRVVQQVWAGPRRQPASLADPEGNPDETQLLSLASPQSMVSRRFIL